MSGDTIDVKIGETITQALSLAQVSEALLGGLRQIGGIHETLTRAYELDDALGPELTAALAATRKLQEAMDAALAVALAKYDNAHARMMAHDEGDAHAQA